MILAQGKQTKATNGKAAATNVMIDIANWLINYLKVDEVVTIVRRDPSSVKFSPKEITPLLKNIDRAGLMVEIERARPLMEKFGIDRFASHQ